MAFSRTLACAVLTLSFAAPIATAAYADDAMMKKDEIKKDEMSKDGTMKKDEMKKDTMMKKDSMMKSGAMKKESTDQ